MACNSYTCVLLTMVIILQISCRIPRPSDAAEDGICSEINKFTCQNQECVSPANARCDGVFQCPDASDEIDCPESGCILPEQPIGGSFELSPCIESPCKVEPGTRVPSNSFLTFECNEGYTLDGNPISFCLTNAWYSPPKCIKTCSFLSSPTVDIVCKYRDEEIPCNSTMLPGTRATLQCKYLYKVPSWDPGYREIVCLETGKWDHSVYTCEPECGKKMTYKGFQGNNNQRSFPWHVIIYRKSSNESLEQICSGTLVKPDLVISAAHCFYDKSLNKSVNASELIVVAGKYSHLGNFAEPGAQNSTVRSINSQIGYNFDENHQNASGVVVVDLKSSFTLTTLVSPICIDFHSQPEIPSGKYGKTVGWGKTELGATSVELEEISMLLIPRNECSSVLPEDMKDFLTEDQFCAGYSNGSSISGSDSGRGFYIQSDGLWYLHGVMSVSPVPVSTSVNNHYSVFTGIRRFRKWIYQWYFNEKKPFLAIRPFHDCITRTIPSSVSGCILPKRPINGNFITTSEPEEYCFSELGERIILGSVITYICEKGYDLDGTKVSVCHNNMWYPPHPPPTCLRKREPDDTDQDVICRENKHFMCENRECIPLSDAQCDGVIQCQDASDEFDCPGSGCTLPEQPIGGSFVLDQRAGSSCNGMPEDKIFSGNFLIYSCNEGYVLRGNIISPCLVNAWFMPPICTKTCPVLTSKSVDIVCKYRDEIVSCNSPMIPGTKATLTCKKFYIIPLGNDPVYREITCLEEGVWDLTVFKCIPECGEPVPRATPLVLRGATAKVGDFPWHVGIYQISESMKYEQICGGTLLSPDLIVSAAHCFYDDTLNEVIDTSQFEVAAGKYFRTYNLSEPWTQYSKVNRIDITENYHGLDGNFAHDIALVRLKVAFTIKAVIKPICLDWDKKREKEDLRIWKSGEVAGWGKTATGKPSTILQKISLPYISLDNCFSMVPRDFRSFITTDKFCAGYINGPNVCQGDSGGGLFFEYRGLWFLRGIVSVSPKPDSFNCNSYYTTFTNVGMFVDWIRDAVLRET